MTGPRFAVALVFLSTLLAGAGPEAASLQRKLESIEDEKLPPGSKVVLTSREINAYLAELMQRETAGGLRNSKVSLGTNRAEGSATADFVKLQTGKGRPPGFFLSLLLRGEHDLAVRVRGKSGGGTAQIDIEEVSIDGLVIRGRTLELLLEYYLIPRVPDIKIGQPFELRHNVERFDTTPDGVTLLIGAKRTPAK